MLYFDYPCIGFVHKIFDIQKCTFVNTLCVLAVGFIYFTNLFY